MASRMGLPNKIQAGEAFVSEAIYNSVSVHQHGLWNLSTSSDPDHILVLSHTFLPIFQIRGLHCIYTYTCI